MADTFSGTPTPLQPATTFTVNGTTYTLATGDTTLMYLLTYMQAVANAHASAAWNAQGVAPGFPVVRNVYPWDPDEVGLSEPQLPAMFLWCPSIVPSYRKADDFFVRETKLKLLWIPQTPPGQDKRKTRGPFGKGLHAILSQALDNMRDPAWVVAGDPDVQAAKQGSILPTFVPFYWLHFASWKPVKWLEKGVSGAPLAFDAFEGDLDMLELWNIDLGRFDLLSGGLVTTYESTDSPALVFARDATF